MSAAFEYNRGLLMAILGSDCCPGLCGVRSCCSAMRGDLRGGTGSGMYVRVGMGDSIRVCPGVLFRVVHMCVRGMACIAWRVMWSTVLAGRFPAGAWCGALTVGAPSVGANVGPGVE